MEQWIPIPDFTDYAVSDQGRVKRAIAILATDKPGGRSHAAGILAFKWAGRNREYAQVSLRKDGKSHYRYVHRLVASAFSPNPNNLPDVNHISGQKINNHADNLEWVTNSENHIHAVLTGLRKSKGVRKTHNGKWQPFLKVQGIMHCAPVCETEDGALESRRQLEIAYFGKEKHA